MPLGFTKVLSKQMSAAFVRSFSLSWFKPAYGEACLPMTVYTGNYFPVPSRHLEGFLPYMVTRAHFMQTTVQCPFAVAFRGWCGWI